MPKEQPSKSVLKDVTEDRIDATIDRDASWSAGGLNVAQIRAALARYAGRMGRNLLVPLLARARTMTPDTCIKLYVYSRGSVPDEIKAQLLNGRRWDSLCSDALPWDDGEWPEYAVQHARYVIVAIGHSGRLMGFLLAADSAHRDRYTLNRRVCKPNELYIDAVCARKGWGGGTRLTTRLFQVAETLGKVQVRLSSLPSAMPFWERLGFVECEVDDPPISCARKPVHPRDPGGRVHGLRMVRNVRTYLDRHG